MYIGGFFLNFRFRLSDCDADMSLCWSCASHICMPCLCGRATYLLRLVFAGPGSHGFFFGCFGCFVCCTPNKPCYCHAVLWPVPCAICICYDCLPLDSRCFFILHACAVVFFFLFFFFYFKKTKIFALMVSSFSSTNHAHRKPLLQTSG